MKNKKIKLNKLKTLLLRKRLIAKNGIIKNMGKKWQKPNQLSTWVSNTQVGRVVKNTSVFLLVLMWAFLPLSDYLFFEIGDWKIALAPKINQARAATCGTTGTYTADAGDGRSSCLYATAGNDTFTPPAQVTSIHVAAWGGGGGGFDGAASGGGKGGGGGAFASTTITVVALQQYDLTVAAAVVEATDGNDSLFNTNDIIADGGAGGSSATTGGGTGGSLANTTCDGGDCPVEKAGGTGGDGYNGGNNDDNGGGGGGAGGPHGTGGGGAAGITDIGGGGGGGDGGNTATDFNGGNSTYGGGGGDGNGTTDGSPGIADVDGGGGGGGADNGDGGGNGGAPGGGGGAGTVCTSSQCNGASGQIYITWVIPSIAVSGTLYSNEGTTAYDCSSSNKTIKASVNGGAPASGTCLAAGGTWSVNLGSTPAIGDPVVVWVDDDANFRAALLTKASTTNSIPLLSLYQNRVIVRHEEDDAVIVTNTNLGAYDGADDNDIQFKENGGAFSVNAGSTLYIWPGTEFAPGGDVTIHGGATAAGQLDTDGSLKLAYGTGPEGAATSSILSMNGSQLILAGSFLASSTPSSVRAPIFNTTSTTTLNATSTVTQNIIATSTPFYNLSFGTTTQGGPGASWNFNGQASTTNNFAITAGTVTLPSTLLDIGGNFSNTGRIIAITGTTTFNGASQQNFSGYMVGTSTLNHVEFSSAGAKTFVGNASTTNFSVLSGSGAVTAPSLFSVGGNYIQSGTFTNNSGTVLIDSTSKTQYLSGTMTEGSAFNNLMILNNFGTDASSSPSVVFSDAASTTGTFTAIIPSSKIRFKAGATTTLQNINISGQAAGTKVSLSAATTTANPTWGIEVPGTALISFADVMDSNACSDNADIDATDGTNLDSGGNSCWTFTIATNKISGSIYNDEGTTAAETGKAIWMRIGTSTPGIFATTTTASSGFYGFEGIRESGIKAGTPITVWVDNDSAFQAAAFTIASTTSNDIFGLNLYQNRVNIRHEGITGTSTTNVDLGIYDRDNDADIQFQANGGNLIVNAGQALYVMPGTEFKPGGSVTLEGNNSTGGIGGNLELPIGTGQNGNATSSIFSLGANTLTLAGSFLASSTSIVNYSGLGGVLFNATTTGKSIIVPGTGANFASTTFNGTNGAWTFASPATTTGDFGISAGTVTAPSGALYVFGNYLNSGTFINNSGTVFFASTTGTQNFAGTMAVGSPFGNLDFSGAGAKTFKNSASSTNFTINSGSGAVTAPSGTLSVSGNFVNSGTFTHNSGTVLMDGTSNTLAGGDTTFNNLTLDPTSAGTINLSSTGVTVAGTLIVASGDTFSLGSGLYATSTGTITLSGTISGAGTLVITDTSSGPGTGGALSTPTRYDATSAAIPSTTLDARTGVAGTGYGGLVEIYSGSSVVARTATLASGTYDFNAGLNIVAANSQNMTLDVTSGNPTITIGATSGDLDFTGNGSGAESIKAGTGSLTVLGNADFTGGTFTLSTGGTLTMNGTAQTLTSAGNELQNVTLSGTITTADNLSATGTLILSGSTIILGGEASTTGNATLSAGSIYPQLQAVILNGSSKTLTGGTGQLGALKVNGSYTLAGSDVLVGSTTVATSSSLTIPATLNLISTSTLIAGGILTGAGTTTVQHSNLGGGGTFGVNFAFGTTTAGISLPSRTFGNNFEVLTGTTVTASNSTTTVGGNYINSGTLTANSGDFRFAGASQQTLSGTMSGSSAFYRLFLENTSGTDATTSPSIIFRNAASTTNTLVAFGGNVKIHFPASATSTFQNIYLNGGAAGTKVMLRSSTAATKFGFEVPGTEENVTFTDFMDTNACDDVTDMDAGTSGNNADSGNNSCISFISATPPTISSDTNQIFEISTGNANSKITVTSGSGADNTVRAQQELRIAIATSTANLWWATSDTSATVDGTGATKACGNANPGPKACTVTYEGNGTAGKASVVVIPVDTDFSIGETLTVENLTFSTGSTANAATTVLKLYLDGGSDVSANATDDKTVVIKGTLTMANNTGGIEYSSWDDSLDPNNQTVSNGELFSFKLTSAGETVNASPIVISLTNIQSVNCGDFSGLDAYVDSDSNGNVNGAETATGTLMCSISGNTGTLTLTNGFKHNAAVDYVLRATTFSNNNPGNSVRFSLSSPNITTSGITSAVSIIPTGSVSEANQFRSNITGGQGGGGGSGEGTHSGETPTGGGGPGGGIGSDPPPTPTETPTGGGDPSGGDGTFCFGGKCGTPAEYFFAGVASGFDRLLAMLLRY